MKILSYIVHTSWIEFKFLKWIKIHGMEFGLKWIPIQHLNSIHYSTIGLKLNWIKLKRNGMQIVESIENPLVNTVLEFFNFKKTQIRTKTSFIGNGANRLQFGIVQVTTYNLWNLKLLYLNKLWWIIINENFKQFFINKNLEHKAYILWCEGYLR
jgi:hypothetical protein